MRKSPIYVAILGTALLLFAGCSQKSADEQARKENQQTPQTSAPSSQPASGGEVHRHPSGAPHGAANNVERHASQSETQPRRAGVIVPVETELVVRTITSLSSKENRPGDTFQGTLENPVTVEGRQVIPKGADVTGRVTTATPSGRLKERAELGVTLTSIQLGGRRYTVSTSTASNREGSKATRDVVLIGGGAGAGAAIGAAVGHGKGAAIGSAIGAAAGTAGAMATGERDVKFPSETVLRFRLEQDLKL